MNAPEGHKYLRAYGTKSGTRWALWQVIDGRAKRVGTAKTIFQWRAFLGLSDTPERDIRTGDTHDQAAL